MTNNKILTVGILLIIIGAIIFFIVQLLYYGMLYEEQPTYNYDTYRDMIRLYAFASVILQFIIFLGIGISFYGVLKSFTFQQFMFFRQVGAGGKDLEELDEKEVELIKCPKCEKTIEVKASERPVMIKCPNCGVKGEVK